VEGEVNDNYDLFEGEKLKKEGMERAELAEVDPVAFLRSYAISHARNYGEVTADDVRRYAEQVGITLKPNAWGSVMKLYGHGCVHRGWTKSHLITNHARENRVWVWVGK
jgi:hypothetical protein